MRFCQALNFDHWRLQIAAPKSGRVSPRSGGGRICNLERFVPQNSICWRLGKSVLRLDQPAREQYALGSALNMGRRAAPSNPAFSSSSVDAISVVRLRDFRGSLARNTMDLLLSSPSTAGRSAV